MIALRLDTILLDLPEGASLDLHIFNPLFDRDGAEALFSIPFTLPATPTNLHALAHANQLDNADNTTTYTNACLIIEGLPFEAAGVLELDGQGFTATGITATFKNAGHLIKQELAKVKLDESLETVSVQATPPIPRWTFAVVNTPPVTVNMTIDGSVFARTFTFGTFPTDYAALADSINATFPGLASASASNLYLDSVLLETHSLESIVNIDLIDKVTPGQSIYQGFLNHVTETNWTPIDTHCWPAISWPGFYKEISRDQFWDFINPWLDGIHIENQPRTDKLWAATYVPFVKSTYILDRIVATLPDYLAAISGWPTDDPDGSQLIIFNNRCLDHIEENYYDIDDRRWLNRMVEEVDLNRHIPRMTADQYLSALVDGFALWWRYDGNTLTFAKKRDMLASPPLDWTALSEPIWNATRKRRRGFSLEYPNLKEEDRRLPDATQLTPYVSGEGWNEYPLPFHSCIMKSLPFANFATLIKCPEVYQAGSSDEAGIGDNAYSLRFLLFRSISPAANGDNYILASSDNTNYAGANNGDLSFDLNAADGLYHLHHKGIPELLADGQPVTLAMRLSIADILTVRKWDNARRTITLPEGQVTAVIKSIKFKVDANGLSVSLVEFVQEK